MRTKLFYLRKAVRNCVLILAAGSLFQSCGSDDNSSGDKPRNGNGIDGFREASLFSPIFLKDDGAFCDTKDKDKTFEKAKFEYYSGNEFVVGEMADTLTSGRQGMSLHVVDGSIKNSKQRILVQMATDNGTMRLSASAEMTLIPDYQYLCDSAPAKNTKEAAAMTAIALLSQANGFYESLGLTRILPEATLNVQPEITIGYKIKIDQETIDKINEMGDSAEDQSSEAQTVDGDDTGDEPGEELNEKKELEPMDKEILYTMTDNAAWSGGSSSQFYIFPQSQDVKNENWFNSVPLWQIPFVMYHEFGHHISSVFFDDLTSSGEDLADPATAFMDHLFIKPEFMQDMDIPDSLSPSDRSKQEYATAIGEAFADMYAHVALNGNTGMDSLNCMSKSRDVASAEFYHGEPKTIDAKAWQDFEQDDDAQESTLDIGGEDEKPRIEDIDCNAIKTQDPHIMGARIAYGVYSLFSMTSLANGQDSTIKLGKALIEWLEKQDAKAFFSTGGEQLVENALLAAYAVAEQAAETDQIPSLCQHMQTQFPYFYDKWDAFDRDIEACFE